MPTVRFVTQDLTQPPRQVEVVVGANLMKTIIAAGLPIGSSCGSIAICAKCVVTVLEGAENLSKPNPVEKKLFVRDCLGTATRISCQTKILGPVTITASYW